MTLKHTELGFEYSLGELERYIQENYKLQTKKVEGLAKKIFEDIHYINELMYLEEMTNTKIDDGVENRYEKIIEKVLKKYLI